MASLNSQTNKKLKNCFLVNAPAGSGKTTTIKKKVERLLAEDPSVNILCITYTKRAAKELLNKIDSKNVYIGTIHSFLNRYMSRFFVHKAIINLYCETYEEQIRNRITNPEKKQLITDSIKKYEDKFGRLDFETIKNNIEKIYYTETDHSAWFYGGLSHDELIKFSKTICDKYPAVNKAISSKYQFIFIDEYQDTRDEVLELFFDSVQNSKSKLYLYGDRMQQIYQNYDGSFEEQFKLFDDELKLNTNYRSVRRIIDILNNLYNDANFVQQTSEYALSVQEDFPPRVIISDDIQTCLNKIKKDQPDILILYLFNKKRFEEAHAARLYNAFKAMEQYNHTSKYSPLDILTTPYEENPDRLMKMLLCLAEIKNLCSEQKYGPIIQILKENSLQKKGFFNKQISTITKHEDKAKLLQTLTKISSLLDDETVTIEMLLNHLNQNQLVTSKYLDDIQSKEDYSLAKDVPATEIVNLYNYLKDPTVSTQHGVKGESHDSVVFVADDSKKYKPIVYMYDFLKMWSEIEVSLNDFSEFYYSYNHEIAELEDVIGIRISDLKKKTFEENKDIINKKISKIIDLFDGNKYFQYICKNKYDKYWNKQNLGNVKDAMKPNNVYGLFAAYKLFYVGCSRARKNLTVLLDKDKIIEDSGLLTKKLESIGFAVEME